MSEGREFEQRVTVMRGAAKTLAWRHSEAQTKVEIDLEPPTQVEFTARYRERALLGEGGMGRVTRCEDRQIGRHVAIKSLLVERRSPSEARRFVREARVQAQLEHPAVVPVYDIGVDDDGHPWFSMKRVSGATLAEIIERLAAGEVNEAWSRRRLLTAMSQVCLAVDFAHQRGVLHRDLKPENVMLGDYGEIYVLDWGLATQLAARSDPEGTNPGAVLGTPGFMAPEQVRGMPLGPTADVYALAAILFELLTLEPLQPIEEVPTMLRRALDGLEVRPSIRAPQRDVPPELEAILVCALDPDPAARHASARALSEAIEAFLDGQRDVELRRKLAAGHAQEATRLLTSGAPEQRRLAMQAIGRALALDPEDPGATAVLRELLTQTPEQRPPEVIRAMASSAARQRAWAGRVAAFAYLSFLLFLPIMWWAGVRDWLALSLFFIASSIAALVSYLGTRSGSASKSLVMSVMLISSVGIAGASSLFGPLVLLPTIAAVNATAYALTFTDRQGRRLTALVAVLTMAIPLALELLGVIAPSYAFTPDGMLVIPRALELREAPTFAILSLSAVASILTGAVTMGRVRDALVEAEQRLYTHTWQIRQLLPDAARPTE